MNQSRPLSPTNHIQSSNSRQSVFQKRASDNGVSSLIDDDVRVDDDAFLGDTERPFILTPTRLQKLSIPLTIMQDEVDEFY